MERIFIYKSDEGHRKGCHPVIELWAARRGVINEIHVFSVDEPGAWFDDCWNCHVDGMDFECATREDAIERGLSHYGYNNNYKMYYEL